jgi:oligoribonuclease (3'-5' exoribonuclease)
VVHQATWSSKPTVARNIVAVTNLRIFQSGLTQACLDSPHSQEEVSKTVLEYIKKWVPQRRVGILAGNSVHADRAFLVKHMPEITDWLHYRSLSLIVECV